MSALPDIPQAAQPPARSARERLAASREQMSRWLDDDAPVQGPASAPTGRSPSRWLHTLRRNPIAAIVLDALGDRWRSHPLASSLHLAEAAAASTVAPLVRKHPAATLGTSAAIGALLVWLKPWRRLLKPALIGGIATQIAAQLISHYAQSAAAAPASTSSATQGRQQTGPTGPDS